MRWRDPQKAFDQMLNIGCVATIIIILFAIAAAFGFASAAGEASPFVAVRT